MKQSGKQTGWENLLCSTFPLRPYLPPKSSSHNKEEGKHIVGFPTPTQVGQGPGQARQRFTPLKGPD